MIVPRLWLAFLAVSFAVCLYFSDRDWSLTNMPRIEELGEVEESAELVAALGRGGSQPGILPYTARQKASRQEEPRDRPPMPRIGYSYRELSILRVPIWGHADQGIVLFLEMPEGYYFVPLDEAQVRALDRVLGTSYADYRFPFWEHLWGWLFLLGLIVWTILHLRAGARLAEEETGEGESVEYSA